VHTIDAWCQRMLREHAFDSGSLFDEELQADEKSMVDEAARDYWRQQIYPLTGDALDAALAIWPSVVRLTDDARGLLVHAKPGSGNEPTLGALWNQAQRERLAALTGLKDGWVVRAQQMREWIESQLASSSCPFSKQKLRPNFVGQWFDGLDQWAQAPGLLTPNLTPTARHRLTPEGLLDARKNLDPLQIPPPFEAFKQLLAALDDLPNPAHAMRLHAASHVARRVQELKVHTGTYGFADMLERLDAALAGPSGGRLRARILNQYPAALIDEFQDTSLLQYRIFDRLYGTAANSRATALFLIGDPKQSIYAFRGADIRSYLQARAATHGRHYALGTSYRSTASLVAAVNHLFGQAEQRVGQGAFKFRRADAPASENPLPFLPVAAHGRTEDLVASSGPVPALTLCHDPVLSFNKDVLKRFAQRCAEHIVTLLNDPQAGFAEPGRGFSALRPADIAVLVRTGVEAEAVRRALRQRGVMSVYLSDKDSVFASPQAPDLLHWLRAVADPLDSRLARAAFATGTIGLSLEELARLSSDDVAFEKRTEQLRQLNSVWRRQGVFPMLRRTLHQLDLPARWLTQPEGERRLTNFMHLAELLQSAATHLDGEQALIRWLVEQLDGDNASGDEQIVRLESDADLVQVITVHKAKGLEYPVVYLPFACSFRGAERSKDGFVTVTNEEGQRDISFRITPDTLDAANHQRQQEDLRLLYVALTRARHALWLGVAALKVGNAKACMFHRSALGYLMGGEREVNANEIAGLLQQACAGLQSVAVLEVTDVPAPTSLRATGADPALHPAPDYAARFERNWSIASFSSLVRDLSPLAAPQMLADAALEEELLAAPIEAAAPTETGAPRHRFPRGAVPGNFLHDQLEWLADERFALATDPDLQQRLKRRCERQGWGHRADDVLAWLLEVLTTKLPPIGAALDGIARRLPEMEFWLPNEGISAGRIDALCRRHLLGGRPRPPLPERTLRGMLMGFADLVFEHGGRYWVLDYKSNALGLHDDDYHRDALEAAMAEHRYDVQAALYLLALHRLLELRLGKRYDPARQLGGAIYLFLRGIKGPQAGCYLIAPPLEMLRALSQALASTDPLAP
jgi:exodeoxyribonuclease V beta subunit